MTVALVTLRGLVRLALESMSLHCTCGSSLARETNGREIAVMNAWLKLHSGPGHALTTALEAEVSRAHEEALFEDYARDPGPRRIR